MCLKRPRMVYLSYWHVVINQGPLDADRAELTCQCWRHRFQASANHWPHPIAPHGTPMPHSVALTINSRCHIVFGEKSARPSRWPCEARSSSSERRGGSLSPGRTTDARVALIKFRDAGRPERFEDIARRRRRSRRIALALIFLVMTAPVPGQSSGHPRSRLGDEHPERRSTSTG